MLVVDDEPLARARLLDQLRELAPEVRAFEAGNGVEAISQIEAVGPDVVLLDVRMPGMDGLETARHIQQLNEPPSVIFTTAYDEHALAAFEASAVDYLLKPIRIERLEDALKRASTVAIGRQAHLRLSVGQRRTHVGTMVAGRLRLVPVDDIVCFRADQGYVSALTRAGEMIVEESLKSLEEEFSEQFVRVHRSALANIKEVAGIEKDQHGNVVLKFVEHALEIQISRRLQSKVRKRLLGTN